MQQNFLPHFCIFCCIFVCGNSSSSLHGSNTSLELPLQLSCFARLENVLELHWPFYFPQSKHHMILVAESHAPLRTAASVLHCMLHLAHQSRFDLCVHPGSRLGPTVSRLCHHCRTIELTKYLFQSPCRPQELLCEHRQLAWTTQIFPMAIPQNPQLSAEVSDQSEESEQTV
jgi:hypothetical protein